MLIAAEEMLFTEMLLEIAILAEELDVAVPTLLYIRAALRLPCHLSPQSTSPASFIVTSTFKTALGFILKSTCAEVARKVLAREVLKQVGIVKEALQAHVALWMPRLAVAIAICKMALKLRRREQMLLARESLAMLQANLTHLYSMSALQVGL